MPTQVSSQVDDLNNTFIRLKRNFTQKMHFTLKFIVNFSSGSFGTYDSA